MRFVPARLRAGEISAGLAGAFSLIVLFALTWYRAPGGTLTGWQCYGALAWAILLSAGLAIAIPVAQVCFRAPAVPVILEAASSVVATITLLWLLVRVLLAAPSGFATAAGVWLALAAQLAVAVTSVWSIRQEGIREADGPGEIPVISLEDDPF